jgi:hypothetical protein
MDDERVDCDNGGHIVYTTCGGVYEPGRSRVGSTDGELGDIHLLSR